MKHQRQLEESRASSATAIKELEQLQNEKRKMLMEHETQKLRDLDDAYGQELREWKGQLKPRKQVSFFLQYRKIEFFIVAQNLHTGAKSSIYPKIHISKISFLTKFTISKPHFSQNLHFSNIKYSG